MDESDSIVITIPLSADMGTTSERAFVIRLQDDLEAAIVAAELGYLDGDGYGTGSADIFFYGSDADAMLEAMRPVLTAADLPAGTSITLFDERTPDGRDAPVP